jgi:hypothetical protein
VRQESVAIASSAPEEEIMSWIERATDYDGWEP